jgi:hypothetical protein
MTSLFEAKLGDQVILGQEEAKVVNGVLIARRVELKQTTYSREYIANMRALLNEAEQKLDEAEGKGTVARLKDKLRGWIK